MSYSVDWTTRVITIPQSDLLATGTPNVYDLFMDSFHREIRRLEWGFTEGLWSPQILEFIKGVTFSGVTTADTMIITNGYTIEFEAGMYAVNLVGANSNIADVAIINSVSIRPQNSVGKQIVSVGSGLSTEEHDKLMTGLDSTIPSYVWSHLDGITIKKMLYNKVTKSGDIITIYEDDGTTVWKQFDLSDGGRSEI